MKTRLAAVLFAGIALLTACSKDFKYSGDGRLIDNGWMSAHERYVVELGRVDLGRTGSVKFKMAGLPPNYFVMGLRVPGRVDRGSSGGAATPADVAVELYRQKFGVITMLTGPLDKWTWSVPKRGDSAFVYQRQGSQSYFDAFTEAHYQVTVTVNTPDPSIPAGTELVMMGGGWR